MPYGWRAVRNEGFGYEFRYPDILKPQPRKGFPQATFLWKIEHRLGLHITRTYKQPVTGLDTELGVIVYDKSDYSFQEWISGRFSFLKLGDLPRVGIDQAVSRAKGGQVGDLAYCESETQDLSIRGYAAANGRSLRYAFVFGKEGVPHIYELVLILDGYDTKPVDDPSDETIVQLFKAIASTFRLLH